MSEQFYCADCRRERELNAHLRCAVCDSNAVSPGRDSLPELPEYSPLHPEERAQIEQALGRRITDEEAMKFIRAGRIMGAFNDWIGI